MIEVSDLSFTYAGRARPALAHLSFALGQGRSLLVLGPSGSGKSTLTLCLNGLIPSVIEGSYSGVVTVAGVVVSGAPVHVLATETGLVFQDPEAQFCTLTVGDEVAFGLENLCLPAEEMGPRITEALELVGLPGFESRRLEQLSGGEKQRVALAAVLAMRPRVIVLDEPSANLDPRGAEELFAVLRRLHEAGGHTIVLIEHRLDEVIAWIDEVMVLSAGGGLLAAGAPRDVFYEAAEIVRSSGVWLPRVVEMAQELAAAGWDVPGRPLTRDELVEALAAAPGWANRPLFPGVPQAPSRLGRHDEVFFRVRDLSFAYPGRRHEPVVRGMSFDIRSGEMVAVVGANGAGKSTLVSLLSGILPPPPGSVYVAGKDARALKAERLAALVGHVFQNPEHQFISDRVLDEIVLDGQGARGRKQRSDRSREAMAWLARFGLDDLAQANPFTLSQGQKRRLTVAAMMARGQEALILDEPTFGQDHAQSTRLLDTLRALNQEGRTIVMVTHDMELVAQHARRVLVVEEGKLVFDGAPAELFALPDLPASWGLRPPVSVEVQRALASAIGERLLQKQAVPA